MQIFVYQAFLRVLKVNSGGFCFALKPSKPNGTQMRKSIKEIEIRTHSQLIKLNQTKYRVPEKKMLVSQIQAMQRDIFFVYKYIYSVVYISGESNNSIYLSCGGLIA
jgi:hypothetical protein